MFKRLKSLFIIEEEETGQSSGKSTPKKPEKPAAKDQSASAVPESKGGAPGKITDRFLEILFGAMEKNNLEGFDYLEYKQSLASLKKMAMDEETRYKSAFAMAQTMKATPQHLIQTAQHYLNILQKEETKFEEALSKQQEKQIGSKKKQIVDTEASIKAKEAEIKKLNEAIKQQRSKVDTLKKQIADATIKVESTKNNFIASYNSLVSQIAKDIENMKNYLK